MKNFLLLILLVSLNRISFGQGSNEYYKKASDFYDKEDYNNALININKALLSDSSNVKYLLLKGNTFEKAKKYQAAFDTYTLGINYHPTDGELYNQRGLLLQKVQETELSISDFTTALQFKNNDTLKLSLLLNRGVTKINVRDFQGAYDDFIDALQIDSLNIGTLNNLASVCDEVGKGDQTLPYLYKIIKIDSNFIGAYGNIGFKFQEMGDHTSAIKYFNKVLQLQPDEPLGYSNRAFNEYKLGDYKAALADINTSIKLYPANSYAFRIRALIFLAQKEKQKACSDIEESLRLGFTKMYGEEVEQLKKDHCK